MLQKIKMVKRKAIESLYDGIATIYELHEVVDENSFISSTEPVKVSEGVKCRVSYKTLNTAQKSETADGLQQQIVMFINPEIVIKPGSQIEVIQRGRTMNFSLSGIPAVYDDHQEVPLQRIEEHP